MIDVIVLFQEWLTSQIESDPHHCLIFEEVLEKLNELLEEHDIIIEEES